MKTTGILSQDTHVTIQSVYYRVDDPDRRIEGIQVDKLPDGRVIGMAEMPLWPFYMAGPGNRS